MEEGSQFKNDLRAFDVLRNLNSLPFELPSYQKVGIDYMKLSYHPGRNIEDLFHDKKLSPSVKSQIEKKYLKTLGDMIRILEGEGFIVSVKRGPLPRIAFQKGVTQIILKPDNFIVNPETLDFTLIDPT